MNKNQETNKPPIEENQHEMIFQFAVVIMATISCYTTAVGVLPMIGVKIFAFSIAVALSLFMVSIALTYPNAKKKGRHWGSIFAYTVVASLSVLLNFNAIYGFFNESNLLYEELNAKRNALTKLKGEVISDIDDLYKVKELEGKLAAVKVKLENEDNRPEWSGKGPVYKKIYREEYEPLTEQLSSARNNAQPVLSRLDSKINDAYLQNINTTLKSENIGNLKVSIQDAIGLFQDVSREMGTITNKDYGNLTFENKNAKNLNFAVNTIRNFSDKTGETQAAIIISGLLSFIIDFIILFVIMFLAPPAEKIDKAKGSKTRGGGIKMPSWNRNGASSNGRRRSKKANDDIFSGRD